MSQRSRTLLWDNQALWRTAAPLLALGILAVALSSPAQTTRAWSLVWADEFAQADGSSPDSSKWTFDVGGNGWGNSELETYTSRTNNARIEGGQLIIEARQENFTGTDGIARNYTSARLKTKGKASWAYGRIEARMKIPRGQGIWPAFWTLGANIDSVGWPNCGEIDIMENIGAEPSKVHGTIHGPGYSGGNGISGSYALSGAAYADDFHVFAVEWETNRIHWYMDDHQYFTATPANIPNGTQWVFKQPQFLLLNVAVGGNWPGNPNATTSFPQRMTVDYVRVYTGTDVPACGGSAGTEIPVPAAMAKVGDNLSISFPTFLGMNYQMRYKNDLSESTWQVLTNMTGNGSTEVVTEPLNAPARFFQVVRVCN